MPKDITRRTFIQRSALLGAGSYLAGVVAPTASASAPAARSFNPVSTPLIITSHSNETGRRAMEAGWEILLNGGSALDAVEKATNIIEDDAEDMSVGLGGLPNERGVVQLDASIMDGKTYSAGSVSSLESIRHASSAARLVMEQTDHVMLVGPGALEFALSWGLEEEDLLTDKGREQWLRWRAGHSDRDDWGPPDHMKKEDERGAALESEWADTHGTVNVLAVDNNRDIAGITSTSGLAYKIPGRIGDSPIIGAGLYVDNQVGAAGATGRGEDVIKACSSFYIVMLMREGRSPQEACDAALRKIIENYNAVGLDYMPGEKFVAINREGDVGCATMLGSRPPRMTVANQTGISLFTGEIAFPTG
jgi:N4-(beta-N-acetylglucosaminyl)-L-asparaginase